MSESLFAREVVTADEARITADFIAFLKAASLERHPTGRVPRFNQGRAAGCVDAQLVVGDGLPAALRVGLFAEPRTYRARIRFANASSSSDRERDVRGMSIAVADVPGDNLTAGAATHDFVLNSHPVMMVPGPKEFLALLQAVEAGGLRRTWFFLSHPDAARIAFASRQHHASHLSIPYWSTTPYLFGPGRAVKYVAAPRPASTSGALTPRPPTGTYLHEQLATHLADRDASFDLMVQFQTDPVRMPIENASVEWRAEESAPQVVARLHIPRQQVAEPAGDEACERLSFNPWHAGPDHRPLGAFNRVRRDIYQAMAAFRLERAAREG